MRIGIYAPYYHPFEGGAERVARRVALGLAGEHEVVVFTLQYDPDLPSEEMDGPVEGSYTARLEVSEVTFVRREPAAASVKGGSSRAADDLLERAYDRMMAARAGTSAR